MRRVLPAHVSGVLRFSSAAIDTNELCAFATRFVIACRSAPDHEPGDIFGVRNVPRYCSCWGWAWAGLDVMARCWYRRRHLLPTHRERLPRPVSSEQVATNGAASTAITLQEAIDRARKYYAQYRAAVMAADLAKQDRLQARASMLAFDQLYPAISEHAGKRRDPNGAVRH